MTPQAEIRGYGIPPIMECAVGGIPYPLISACGVMSCSHRSGARAGKIVSTAGKLVSPAGLEPATHSLEGCCSVQLSYGERRRFTCEPVNLVGARGFEPPTPCSQSRCA